MKQLRNRLYRCLSRLIKMAWCVLCASVCMFGEEVATPLSALMSTANRMADPTPKAWSMSPASEAVMDYSSGTASIGVDLMSLKVGNYTLGVGLNYQLRAYKAREESGWIGLGWSLSGTGVVTRTIAGLPDELGYESRTVEEIINAADWREYFRSLETRRKDALLDRYSYSCPGGSGQFVVIDGRVVQLPQSDNVVEIVNKTANDSWEFRVTTPDGTRYEFTTRENCTYTYKSMDLCAQPQSFTYTATTAWHLSSIILPEGADTILYQYVTAPAWTRVSTDNTQTVSVTYNSLELMPSSSSGNSGTVQNATDQLIFNNPKILSKIVSRNGTITAIHDSKSYTRPGPTKYIRGFKLSNCLGDTVLEVSLIPSSQINRRLLKSIIFQTGDTVLDERKFSYHASGNDATEDFFGYPNGKSSIGNPDHGAVDMISGRFSARRMPDSTAMLCDALSGWTTASGLHTSVTYEPSLIKAENRYLWSGRSNSLANITDSLSGIFDDRPGGGTTGGGNVSLPSDTIVGLRVSSIKTTDNIGRVTTERSFKYGKPRCSVNLAGVAPSEFIGVSGTWKYDFSQKGDTDVTVGRPRYLEIVTTVAMLHSSTGVGVAPEHCIIYYGEVEETISGTGLSNGIKRLYRFDTSDCQSPLIGYGYVSLPDIKKTYMQMEGSTGVDARQLCHGEFTGTLVNLRSLVDGTLKPPSYRQERIGYGPVLLSVTDFEYVDNEYRRRLCTEYSYDRVDEVTVPVGTHYMPVVRQNLAMAFKPEYEYKSVNDFAFGQFHLKARRALKRSETTTRYYPDSSSRKARIAYHYTGDSVYNMPDKRFLGLGDFINEDSIVFNRDGHLFNPFRADSLNTAVKMRLPIGSTVTCGSHSAGSYVSYAMQSSGAFSRQACLRKLLALPLAQMTIRDGDTTLTCYSYGSVGAKRLTRPTLATVWQSQSGQNRNLTATRSFDGYNSYGLPQKFKATGSAALSYSIDGHDQIQSVTVGSGDMTLTSRYTYLPLIGCNTVMQPDGLQRRYGYDGLRLTSVTGRDSLLISYNYLHHNRVVRSSQYFIKSTPSVSDAYTNAAGRAMQTVRYDYGADCGTDVVEGVTHYDALGRPVRKYQPVAMDWHDYSYALNSDIIESSGEVLWGASTPYAYTSLSYPASAQPQPMSTVLPGSDMVGHASTAELTCSSTTDAARKVRRFSVSGGILSMGQLYGDGELDCSATTDADGRRMWIFTDWEGKNILRRQESENNVYADTYFVYDTQGRLAVVLPPIASKELTDGSLTCARAVATKAYTIRYDYKSRPIATKRPGCAAVRTAYDGENRAVFTRDGSQLAKGRRTFNVYDNLNRVVITGTCLDADADSVWATGRDIAALSCGHAGRRGTGFCNTGYTLPAALTDMLQDARILNVFYYDGYSHLSQTAAPDGTNPSPKGRQTGSLTAVLGEGYNDKLVGSDIYYDMDGNVLRSTSELYRGGCTQIDTEYNPYGLPLKERHTVRTYTLLQLSRVPELKTLNYTLSYTHDRHGRTTATALNYLGKDYQLSEVTFDSLGRVSTVTSQGDIVRSTQYDLRGMVRAWSTPAVSQQLKYTDGTVPSYTGRVSSKLTDAGSQFHSRYDYSYDKLGRLVAANQQDIDAADADFSTNYAYDLESNITRLQRRGKTAPTQYGLINDITATYDCGQITGQDDECETGTYEGNLTLTPVQSGSIQSTGPPTSAGSDGNACTYDADGRLIKDPSRGIANIVYNEIGMPQKVLFNNGAYIGYVYLANGKKVEQTTCQSISQFGFRPIISKTIYDEAFEINFGTIQRLNVPGGYVTPRDSVFHLYVPDYQGNNVAVINTETGQAEQLTDYYPYGQPINNGLGASVNPYKYGGKELLTANGYNASDFAARWLSHSLPGFQSPDPLSHETPWLSMYAYCGGDPINLIDPTGCRPVFSRQAVLLGVTDEGGLQGDYIVVDKNSYKLGMSTDDVMKQSISKNDLSSSEIKRIEYAQSTLKNRPDYDGGLTHAEARDWYRKGTGSPLYVNLKTLDLSNVEPHGNSKVGEKVVVNMFWQSSNKDDQLVYGNITLKRYPNNSVRAFSDKYDFDLKSWDSPTNIIRNILTVCGEIVVGKGISFQIHFYGTATLTNEKETKK